MESTAKTNLWMEEEEDEQLIELLPPPDLEDDPLQLAPPLIVDPLETMRITRRSTRISKIASPSKSLSESSSVKPVPKIEPIEGEIVPNEEYEQDLYDSFAVSTKVIVRIIQTCTETPEEDERKKRCCKIVSKAEEKRRLERDNERRRQKRPNESTAVKEERERIRKRKEKQTEGEGFEKGLESVSDAERKKLLRYKANAERRRQKLANESAAEKEERLKKQRERKRSQRAQESLHLSEEEKKEHLRKRKQAEFFRWEAKKASMTPEEIEQAEFQRKMKIYLRNVARKASLTPEEKNRMEEARRQRHRKYYANLPEEKRKGVYEKMRAYWQNLPVETKREKSRMAMKTYHKKLMETNPAKYKKILDKVKENNRRKIATETPEQRHKRLLKDKVKQAKRRARMKMEAEGISPEEIERRLEEVVREVEEKDRLERERNPVDPADYKPRENARKPRKRTKVTAPQTSELESEAVVRPQMLPFHSSSPLTGAPILDFCLPTSAPEQPSHFEAVSSSNVEELNEARVEGVNIQEVSETIPEISAQDDDYEPVEADHFSERSQSPTYSHSPPVSPLDHSEDTHHLITERVSQAEAPAQDKICEDDSRPNLKSDPQNAVAEAAIPHYDSAASMNGPTEQDLPTTIRKEQIREKESPPSPLPSLSSSPLPTAIENEKVDEVDRVKCDECGKMLRPTAFKFHKFTFHNPNRADYKCPTCSETFTTARSLWDHYLNFHEETLNSEQAESPFIKLKRGKSSSTLPQEKKNSTTSKIDPFVCEQCGNKYTQKAQMDAHVRRVHFDQRFICDVCGKEEQTGGKLWKHKIANHPEIETPAPEGMVVCEYCSEPVLRSYQFHVKKYHPENYDEFEKKHPILKGKKVYRYKRKKVLLRIKCPECDKEIRADTIKRHLRNVHGHGTNSFPCRQCDKVFKENYNLNEHIRTTHTLNSFDRKVEEMELIKEKKDEDGELIYSCSVCEERVFRKKDMGGHLLTSHFDLYEQLKQTGDDAEPEESRVVRKRKTPKTPTRKKVKKTENNEPVNCDECGKSLHPEVLKRHKHLMHNQSGKSNNGYSEKVLKNHLPKCDNNPDKVLTVKVKRSAKKKYLQKNIIMKKRTRVKSETEEKTESYDDNDGDTKRSKSLMEIGTRRSSRIKIKQDKKLGKKLKAKVAQGSLGDDKLNMEVKVRVERLTKEQIDFCISTKYP